MSDQLPFDDDLPLLIEITPIDSSTDTPMTQNTSEALSMSAVQGAIREAYHDSVRQAFNTIYQMAQRTGYMVDALQDNDHQEHLDTVEIQFGLNFSTDLAAFIAKTGADATIQVKITWKVDSTGDSPS